MSGLSVLTHRKITTGIMHPISPAIYEKRQDLYHVIGNINQILMEKSEQGDEEYPVFIGLFEAIPLAGSLVGKCRAVKSAKLILPSAGGEILYAQLIDSGIEIGKKLSSSIQCGFLIFSEPHPKGSKYSLGCESLMEQPIESDPLSDLRQLAIQKFTPALLAAPMSEEEIKAAEDEVIDPRYIKPTPEELKEKAESVEAEVLAGKALLKAQVQAKAKAQAKANKPKK